MTIRLAARALALAPALYAGAAAAHPGHATPHLLHQGDAALGWWAFALVAAAGVAAWRLARKRF